MRGVEIELGSCKRNSQHKSECPGKGTDFSVCVRTILSPLQGLLISHFIPRLAPWAAFYRRFAAKVWPSYSTAEFKSEFSRTHFQPCRLGRRIMRALAPEGLGLCVNEGTDS